MPQLLSNQVDFSDSNRNEREEEESLGFGMRPYMVENFSIAGNAAKPTERERERAGSSPPRVVLCDS